MQLSKIGITYERKVNLGDYNSATITMNLWANVDPWDKPEEVAGALWEMAKNNVKAQVVPITVKDEKIIAEVKKLFLGLPVVNMTEEEVIQRMAGNLPKQSNSNPALSTDESKES